jgi:hypothetical protein
VRKQVQVDQQDLVRGVQKISSRMSNTALLKAKCESRPEKFCREPTASIHGGGGW